MNQSSLQLFGRIVLITVLVALAVWVLRRFLPALAWAAVLAIATWPLREWLTAKGVRTSTAAISLAALVGILIVGPLVALAIQMAREAVVIVEGVRDLRESGLGTPDWVAQLPLIGDYAAAWWAEHLADPDAAKELLGRAESMGVVQWGRSFGSELIDRLVVLAFTLLTLFFAYRDGPRIIEQTRTIADRLFGPSGEHLGKEAILAVRATVNGLVLVGLAEGAVLGAAYFVAGVPHPVLFGFATALLATVPFGAPLVYVIACLMLIAQSHVSAAVLLFLFASAVVLIADHFVRPAFIGMSTRLPFLWILLGIFGGLETFGLVGLFLGPAIMAAVLAVWREGAEPANADAISHQ
jgi:predicted PurR-regulated permease PerM